MTGPDPRSALKQLVKAGALTRPLFIPVLFAVAAKVEGTPLPGFLSNPTQIANTLRRMQGFLRLDSVTCYYDSLVTAEALGCSLNWDEYPPVIVDRPSLLAADLRESLGEGIESRGRVPVALEVVRRLRIMLGQRTPLVAGVTGPFALSRQLAPDADESRLAGLLDATGSVFLQVAQKLCEAGADLILVEEELPPPSSTFYRVWKDRLASAGRVIRFYEALPVLPIPGESEAAAVDAVLSADDAFGDFVLCPSADSLTSGVLSRLGALRSFGLALPPAALADPQSVAATLAQHSRELGSGTNRLVLVTTAGEIPHDWDVKQLPRAIGALRSARIG